MMRKWTVRSQQLGLTDGTDFIIPTSAEIYASVVQNKIIWPDVPVGSDNIPNLRFSRYPANVKLKAEDKDGCIMLTLICRSRSDEIIINAFPDQDHFISNNIWYSLDLDDLSSIRALMKESAAEFGSPVSIKSILKLKHAALKSDRIVFDLPDLSAYAPKLMPQGGAPKDVIATLYPYQVEGWNWLKFLISEKLGGLLADEMGLGKTLQIISLLADPGSSGLKRTLVVATGSLLENWARELKKFAPKLNTIKHHGSHRTGNHKDLKSYDVVITSYDSIIRDLSLFNMIDWDLVVLDEAQNIKSPDALRTNAVKRLKRSASIAVTGTPFENRLTDIWSIIDFVMPEYLGNRTDFDLIFPNSPEGAENLEPFISPLMLRRRVAEVAKDLPDRIDIPQVIELDAEEARQYEKIRSDIQEKYGKAASLVSIGALRQYCAHPSLVDASSRTEFSKLTRLNEILEEIFSLGEKALIFTTYNDMSKLLCKICSERHGVFAKSLNGDLPINDRQPLIDEFASVTGPAVLVLNPKAGGAGLNITAANHVIHYNLEWNPALEDQASARAFRRGQTRPVTVHRLFYAGTVEEVVNERVSRKRDLSDTAVIGVTGQEQDYIDIMSALQRSPVRGKE